jgi:hypothetical protein
MSLLDRLRQRRAAKHASGYLTVVIEGREMIRLDQFGVFKIVDGVTPEQVLQTLASFFLIAEEAANRAGHVLPIMDVIVAAKGQIRRDPEFIRGLH